MIARHSRKAKPLAQDAEIKTRFLQFFSQEFDHGKTEFPGTLLVLALSARAADVRT